jgi:hypothetical protein
VSPSSAGRSPFTSRAKITRMALGLEVSWGGPAWTRGAEAVVPPVCSVRTEGRGPDGLENQRGAARRIPTTEAATLTKKPNRRGAFATGAALGSPVTRRLLQGARLQHRKLFAGEGRLRERTSTPGVVSVGGRHPGTARRGPLSRLGKVGGLHHRAPPLSNNLYLSTPVLQELLKAFLLPLPGAHGMEGAKVADCARTTRCGNMHSGPFSSRPWESPGRSITLPSREFRWESAFVRPVHNSGQ